MRDGRYGVDSRIANGIAVWVAFVWGAGFLADIVSKSYSPPLALHGVMMAVVGVALGIGSKSGEQHDDK